MMSTEDRASLAPYEMVRQTTSSDLITLPAGAILGTTAGNPLLIYGLTVPLGDQYVLIPSEQTSIAERTTAFNNVIKSIVDNSNNRLALADVNAAYSTFLASGINIEYGATLTANISPPYAGFSEDGVHPNGRGYGFMANVYIKAINAKFGSKIPLANISKYKGTVLPLYP